MRSCVLPAQPRGVLFETGEGLGAEVVLDLAGVQIGGVTADAGGHQQARDRLMPVVDAGGDLPSGAGQRKLSVVDRNVAAALELVEHDAHGRPGEAQTARDIHGAHRSVLPEDQNRFQIILCGFADHARRLPWGFLASDCNTFPRERQ